MLEWSNDDTPLITETGVHLRYIWVKDVHTLIKPTHLDTYIDQKYQSPENLPQKKRILAYKILV